MKKLGKLRLNEFRKMNDSEMKSILGGYDSYGEPTENCSWFFCKCSEPTYGSYAQSVEHLVKGYDIITVTDTLIKGDCKSFAKVTCSFDKKCS